MIEVHKSSVEVDNLPLVERAPVESVEVVVVVVAVDCKLLDYRSQFQKLLMSLAVHLVDHRRVDDAASAQVQD